MSPRLLPFAPAAPLPAPYVPGLHSLATFGAPAGRLRDASSRQQFFAGLVARLGLTSVGEVYHVFAENAGFTAVLALTKSHLSIHTWPEHGLATFDVFLSNFRRDNHGAHAGGQRLCAGAVPRLRALVWGVGLCAGPDRARQLAARWRPGSAALRPALSARCAAFRPI